MVKVGTHPASPALLVGKKKADADFKISFARRRSRRAASADLGSECDLLGELLGFGFDEPDAGLVEAVGTHVTSGDGPFVVLFGE